MTIKAEENDSQKSRESGDRVTGNDDIPVIYTRIRVKRPIHKADHLMNLLSERFSTITQNNDLKSTCESLLWPFILKFFIHRKDLFPKQYNRLERSAINLILKLLPFFEDGEYQSYIKYWHDIYLCRVCKDPQTPEANDVFKNELYTGILRRIVRYALLRNDTSFIYSLQKGSKRVWPCLPVSKKMKSLEKHRNCLSGNFPDFDPYIPDDLRLGIAREGYLIFRPILEDQICENFKINYTKFSPSLSACLQNSRLDLGSSGLFDAFPLGKEILKEEQGLLGFKNTDIAFEKWKQKTLEIAIENISDENSQVDSISLDECSKFRTITMGDGYEYAALQPFQGALLDCWKETKYSTMLEPDLAEKVRKIDLIGKDLPIFCSVDYESATDFLKREATCELARLFKETKPFGKIVWDSLVKDILVKYPKYYDEPPKKRKEVNLKEKGYINFEPIELVNGQLMGHPLSFPLLCTINLACYHVSIDRWVQASGDKKEKKRRKKIGRTMYDNVIVNGDDMLFKCEPSFYEIFIQTTKEVGLRISKGKNYCSEFFCMINSQIFQRENGLMVRQGYFNQKVLKKVDPMKGQGGACTIYNAIETFNEMIKFCPWAYWSYPALIKEFKYWDDADPQPNYFLPQHMGGLGLACPDYPRITRKDRMIASFYYSNPEVSALISEPGLFSIPRRYREMISKPRYVLPDSVPYLSLERESKDILTRILTMFKSSLELYHTCDECDKLLCKICHKMQDDCAVQEHRKFKCADCKRWRNSKDELEELRLAHKFIHKSEVLPQYRKLSWGEVQSSRLLSREELICFSYFIVQVNLVPSIGCNQILGLPKREYSEFCRFPSITTFW
jgi:hypothetical protein